MMLYTSMIRIKDALCHPPNWRGPLSQCEIVDFDVDFCSTVACGDRLGGRAVLAGGHPAAIRSTTTSVSMSSAAKCS
jgi:hypothetical protein